MRGYHEGRKHPIQQGRIYDCNPSLNALNEESFAWNQNEIYIRIFGYRFAAKAPDEPTEPTGKSRPRKRVRPRRGTPQETDSKRATNPAVSEPRCPIPSNPRKGFNSLGLMWSQPGNDARTPPPSFRECTAYLRLGGGGMPLALRLREELGGTVFGHSCLQRGAATRLIEDALD